MSHVVLLMPPSDEAAEPVGQPGPGQFAVVTEPGAVGVIVTPPDVYGTPG
jgi:hypothetical protein